MEDLYTLLERSLTQLGYELVDLEVSNRGKLLRLFIDKPEGVNIDDCVLVSNQLSNSLAVDHDIDYDRLEVSSPGMDRVLKKEADYVRFTGERAQVKLRILVENRKNFVGVLRGLEDGMLLIECEGIVHKLALSNIDKARLSPEF
ncbi:ribosome maturation factor RimP [Methyloradius palustris]|uniref:Ribosome maturation factor RimP n=1 Tax=Methyloradius palustris TaxID=2778876 RepID=A0A8D5G5Q1_9PROT|nr:ribosome maturation factor RimP [Methyloradius palustris]BCM23811.1 ribosome maturation factor RimP [Methyloradius palustris]